MQFAHLTLATREVQKTAEFLEQTLGYSRDPSPPNSPVETIWLSLGNGQQFHVTFVAGFETSPFEGEFGRHIAVFYPQRGFDELKARLHARGATITPPLRPSGFERFFFREPVNGYVFEVIDDARQGRPEGT